MALAALASPLTTAALAQVCQAELSADFDQASLGRAPTGLDAAAALRRAVELVEPALPPLQYDKPVPAAEE